MSITFSHGRVVTLIRRPGTAQEERIQVRAGGDLEKTALFMPETEVRNGDLLEVEWQDKPKQIDRVIPKFVTGALDYYEATLKPAATARPRRTGSRATGIRVSVGSGSKVGSITVGSRNKQGDVWQSTVRSEEARRRVNDAVRKIEPAIRASKNIAPENKKRAKDVLDQIAAAAKHKDDQKVSSTLKRAVKGFPKLLTGAKAISDLWEKHGPTIMQFFGIS